MSERGRELDRLAELEEERRFLLRSLDDLDREHGAGDVDDHDYETLRDGYTARAAAVIREIESGRDALAAPTRTNWKRIGLIALGAVALAVLAGVLVARYSGQDVPDAGSVQGTSDEVAELLAQARVVGLTDSLRIYDQVLTIEPQNVEALTYRGWALRLVAQIVPDENDRQRSLAAAIEGLDHAAAIDPAYPDAQCFLAVIQFRDKADAAAAKAHLDACLAADPPALVKDLVASLGEEIDAALG